MGRVDRNSEFSAWENPDCNISENGAYDVEELNSTTGARVVGFTAGVGRAFIEVGASLVGLNVGVGMGLSSVGAGDGVRLGSAVGVGGTGVGVGQGVAVGVGDDMVVGSGAGVGVGLDVGGIREGVGGGVGVAVTLGVRIGVGVGTGVGCSAGGRVATKVGAKMAEGAATSLLQAANNTRPDRVKYTTVKTRRDNMSGSFFPVLRNHSLDGPIWILQKYS